MKTIQTTAPLLVLTLAAWEQEKYSIKTKETFQKYLDEKLAILNKKNKL